MKKNYFSNKMEQYTKKKEKNFLRDYKNGNDIREIKSVQRF